jgi:acetolactate synthase-1/2/3 large subunit
VVGDGGFQMTMCELATAVQDGINIKVAIINNGYLGMVRQWQEFFYERRYAATPLSGPDFVKLGEAFGIRSRAVSVRADVLPAIADATSHEGPVVVDFRSNRKTRVSDGARRRRSARDDPQAEPIVETAAD